MGMHSVKVELGRYAHGCKVWLDGKEITAEVVAVKVEARVDEPTRLTLELINTDCVAEGEVEVVRVKDTTPNVTRIKPAFLQGDHNPNMQSIRGDQSDYWLDGDGHIVKRTEPTS